MNVDTSRGVCSGYISVRLAAAALRRFPPVGARVAGERSSYQNRRSSKVVHAPIEKISASINYTGSHVPRNQRSERMAGFVLDSRAAIAREKSYSGGTKKLFL